MNLLKLFQNGIQSVENKDYNQSVIFFKQYIELEPNDINGFINISNAYYEIDELVNSMEYIAKALKIDPNFFPAVIEKNSISNSILFRVLAFLL